MQDENAKRVVSYFLLPDEEKRTGSPSCCWLCDHENKDNAGGREESERTRVLVDIIELLMTLSLVFQLENLQIYLVFNPL